MDRHANLDKPDERDRHPLDRWDRVAARTARFGRAKTLRRVFAGELGVTPKAYRERFRTTAR
ncbi:hypothetical protein HNP40_001461 [Mycobacteroides chelonae]|nr:hypothetical protein [Mycobacteroides chelonae]